MIINPPKYNNARNAIDGLFVRVIPKYRKRPPTKRM